MKVLVDYTDIINKYGLNPLIFGSEGWCLINDNIIEKFYHYPKNIEIFNDFSSYKSHRIAFPFYYLYNCWNEQEVVGEVMPYFNKKTILLSLDGKNNVDKLIYNYQLIMKELEKFPEIKMKDLVAPNILYDDISGFSIIDTTSWQFMDGDNSAFNKGLFSVEVSELVLDLLLEISPINLYDFEFKKNLLKYGNYGQQLLRVLQGAYEGEDHFVEILELYKSVFDLEKQGNLMVKDLKKYTKMLKKD